jgi:putative NIF3 family GTP cyclohydrolase 1 type 2
MGRVGSLQKPAGRPEIYQRIKDALHLEHLLVAGPQDGMVHRAAVCAGACGEFVEDALAAQVDLFLTGEMRHHDVLKAAAMGLTVVCTLHSNSERAVLSRLRDRITAAAKVSVQISAADRDPFSIA